MIALIPLAYLLLLLFQKDLSLLGDLGRHLRLGEVVVHCLCVPQINLFSYTAPTFPIVNHEWLAEVIFYLTSVVFGLSGLLVLKMILVITTATLLYKIALKNGSLFWVTIFSLLSITLFSMRFFVLPELFSYLFISLFIFLIERYKNTKKKYLLWLLPILEILWVNMHIYFVLGIVLYGFFFIETWIKQKKFPQSLFLIGVCLLIAPLINPSFIHGALLPFTFLHNYGFTVEENESLFMILNPSSTNTNIAYTLLLQVFLFEMLLVLFFVGLFLKKQWKEIFHMGNGLAAVGLAMKFTRCIGLFSLLGFIPLVQTFTLLEEKIKKSYDEQVTNLVKGMVVFGVLIIVGIHISGLFAYHILDFGFEPSAEKAVNFIQQAHLRGRIFNNYIIGNYLIYKLYPSEQVYVDARPEAYPASFFTDYWNMMADAQFFNQQVKKYNINAIVFNVAFDDPAKIRPFLIRVLADKNWVPVYADGTVTIIVRNNEANRDVIKKYRIVE